MRSPGFCFGPRLDDWNRRAGRTRRRSARLDVRSGVACLSSGDAAVLHLRNLQCCDGAGGNESLARNRASVFGRPRDARAARWRGFPIRRGRRAQACRRASAWQYVLQVAATARDPNRQGQPRWPSNGSSSTSKPAISECAPAIACCEIAPPRRGTPFPGIRQREARAAQAIERATGGRYSHRNTLADTAVKTRNSTASITTSPM